MKDESGADPLSRPSFILLPSSFILSDPFRVGPTADVTANGARHRAGEAWGASVNVPAAILRVPKTLSKQSNDEDDADDAGF
jgi:hypothetical protein